MNLWTDYPRATGAAWTLLAVAILAGGAWLRTALEPIPGHTHPGTTMKLDCNGCGAVLADFVRAQIAQVNSQAKAPPATMDAEKRRK